MRRKASTVTFDKILAGEINLDKARHSANLVPGYQWDIKEFDYQAWQFTGRQLKAEIKKIMQIVGGDIDIASINKKYIFFKFDVVE